RIGTLEGAQRNASNYGYPGAKYAWESSVTGDEQCHNWQYCDHEVHVTADVVFGLWHSYTATGDLAFLTRAMPVFAETARYWLARCKKAKDGSVHLNGVMGPDEYICLCNDNAYTNYMVANALRITLQASKLLNSKLLCKSETDEIVYFAQHLSLHRCADGVLQQCRDFDAYEEPDFDVLWPDRTKPFGAAVSQERNYRTKALKQADVLMLPYLYPTCMSDAELEATYQKYYPLTTHDSSLSYIIHSILKAHLNHADEALALFEKALAIDTDGGAAEGIHIANCGGIWQGVVIGFCGMQWSYSSNQLTFIPHLPKNWRRVSFKIQTQGKQHTVVITKQAVTIDGEAQTWTDIR
ncbi:MAG: glycosyl hydrolase family 65 protein, partial [Ruthenibacterium sp.]